MVLEFLSNSQWYVTPAIFIGLLVQVKIQENQIKKYAGLSVLRIYILSVVISLLIAISIFFIIG